MSSNNNLNNSISNTELPSDDFKCILCNNKPNNPYKCSSCGKYACESCYLEKFDCDTVSCENCGASYSYSPYENVDKSGFTPTPQSLNNINNNSINENQITDNGFNENNNNMQTNLSRILSLNNNLDFNCKNAINNAVSDFKNKILWNLNLNFEDYLNKKAEEIYYKMLEKFTENAKMQNRNINEAMKDKQQLMDEAKIAMKEKLHDSAEENFLKKVSELIYKDIISKFEQLMLAKINEYIKNIPNNKKVNSVFESYGLSLDGEEIELGKKFEKYIEKLKDREDNSAQKSLILQFGNQSEFYENQGESSSCGNSSTPAPSGSSK